MDSSDISTWYKLFFGWNSANARCCSQRGAMVLNAWHDSPPVWCTQNVLTGSGKLLTKTATKSASATCNPVAPILLDNVPSNLEYLAISKSIFLIVSVTMVLALVSLSCSAKDFPAKAVLKLSASLCTPGSAVSPTQSRWMLAAQCSHQHKHCTNWFPHWTHWSMSKFSDGSQMHFEG